MNSRPSAVSLLALACLLAAPAPVGSSSGTLTAESADAPSRVVNLSVRGQAGAGDDRLIMGFVLTGPGQRSVVVRGVGPAIDRLVNGALEDPHLTTFRHPPGVDPIVLATNTAWSDGPDAETLVALTEQFGLLRLAPGSLDAALLQSAGSGIYTAHVSSGTGESGVALAEVYDVTSGQAEPTMTNVSARMAAGTGDNVLILGFVIEGTTPLQVLLRAVGPGLAEFGLPQNSLLADPFLQVFRRVSGDEIPIANNTAWGAGGQSVGLAEAFSSTGAFGLQPGSRDAALLLTLEPGVYTAVVSGAEGGTGIALAEVYVVNLVDALSPQVGSVQAILRTVGGQQALELRVAATDNRGVAGVTFLERLLPGGEHQSLGAGSPAGGDMWSMLAPGPVGTDQRTFLARARDGAGNDGSSAEATFAFVPPAPGVAALGADGRPVPGGLVSVDTDGNLGPFGVAVGGGGSAGQGAGLMLGFPAGGRIVEREGRRYVQFSEAAASFGRSSNLQFGLPLVRGAPAQAAALARGRFTPANDPPPELLELPMDGITPQDLAAVFGLDPAGGIPVTLFGMFSLRWLEGTLTADGIEGARFAVDVANLPLPGASGDYGGLVVDLSDTGRVRLPFHGEFPLPDGTDDPPRLAVAPAHPLWLELRADGGIALGGRGELTFADGGRLLVDIHLDDPEYRLSLVAEEFEVALLDSLADLLPSDAAALVPGTAAEAQLDIASRGLLGFARAFHHFAASATGVVPVGGATAPESLPAEPPGSVATVASLLDAWAYAAASPAAQATNLQALQDLVRQIARATAASRDSASILRHRAALARARVVLDDPGYVSALPGMQEDLDAALETARAAAIARSREPDAIGSIQSLNESIRLLVETEEAMALGGHPPQTDLLAAAFELMDRFLRDTTRVLGVRAGEYTLAGNPTIAGMNRFVAYQRLFEMVQLFADAQALGFEVTAGDYTGFSAPVGELVTQLGIRLADTTYAELDTAEAAVDYGAFLHAFTPLLELLAERQLGFFPGNAAADAALSAAGLPLSPDFTALVDRLGALLAANLALPAAERSWNDRAGEIERLLSILESVPVAVSFASFPFTHAFDQMDESLDGALLGLALESRRGVLVRLIEAGNRHARLGRQFANDVEDPLWESTRLPLVVDRLLAVAGPGRGWSELHAAARALLDEADQIDIEAGRPGLPADQSQALQTRRRHYLVQAARLIDLAREVAVAVWQESEGKRADAALDAFDRLLPGNVKVRRVFGAISYQRISGAFRGALGGRLELPGLLGGASLEILNASISSAGSFDLSVLGSLSGVPLGALSGDFAIPARRPLRVSYRAGRPLEISGGGSLQLSNGISFEGYVDLADPVYRFGISAGGLRLDLAEKLTTYVPTVSIQSPFTLQPDGSVEVDPAFAALSLDVAGDLDAYWRSLGATFEPLAGLVDPLEVGAPGTPPEFVAPAASLEFDTFTAWANGLKQGAGLQLDAGYGTVLAGLKTHLARLAAESAAAPGVLDDLSIYLQTLRRATEMEANNEKFRQTLEVIAVRQDLGIDTGDILDDPQVRAHLDASRAEVEKLFTSPLTTGNRANALRVATLALEMDATDQVMGNPVSFTGGPGGNRLAPFLDATFGHYLRDLGLHAGTGAIENAAVFNGLTRRELTEARTTLLDLQASLQASGDEGLADGFQGALNTISTGLYNRTVIEYRATQSENWAKKQELLHEVLNLAGEADAGVYAFTGDVEKLAGGAGPFSFQVALNEFIDPYFETETQRRRDEVAILVDPHFKYWRLLRRLSDREIPEQILTGLREALQRQLDRILPAVLEPLPVDAIPDSQQILRDLLEVIETAEAFAFSDILGPATDLALPRLTVRFTAVAESRRAWWLASEQSRLLLAALERRGAGAQAAVDRALQAALAETLRASGSIGRLLRDDLAARVSAGWTPAELRLPGDLVVRRAFGDFLFDRSVPVFTARFGGEVEFPAIDGRFEVVSAAISSDGAWALDVRTSGPLPVVEGVRFTFAVQVAGGPGLAVVPSGAGSGTLVFAQPFLPGGAPPSTFETTVNYAVPAGGTTPVLTFSGTGAGALAPVPDFAVFAGQVQLTFGGGAAPEAALELAGKAGFLLRAGIDPERSIIKPEDFGFVVDDSSLDLVFRTDGVDATFTGGTLTLAPAVHRTRIGAVLCDDIAGPLPERGPTPPSVALPVPLRLEIDMPPDRPPTMRFGTLGGQPFEIVFSDFGFDVPGFPGFALDVCTTRVVFAHGVVPEFSDLDARLALPLPRSDAEGPVLARVQSTRWRLDGLPDDGQLSLHSDIALVDTEAFGLDLLGAGCGADGAFLRFEIEDDGTDGFDFTFTARAGMAARISGSLVETVEINDAAVEIEADGSLRLGTCGTFSLHAVVDGVTGESTYLTDLQLDRVSICGRFRLGGALDLRGEGGSGTLACLTLDGLSNVLAPSEEAPFVIGVSGQLGFGDFAYFGITNGRFLFQGGDAPVFDVEKLNFVSGENLRLLQQDLLPFSIDSATLEFLQDPGQLTLEAFRPENLQLIVSGSVTVGIPGFAQTEDDQGEGDVPIPSLSGGVQNLAVTFPDGFSAPPHFALSTLVLELKGLTIGDFGGLSGGLAVGNIDDPLNLFFAGTVGGALNGVKVKATLAMTLEALVGICLDVNAGPAGIPLDGGTLGGILLTGASGGLSFGNTYNDPCNFKSLLGLGPDGRPAADAADLPQGLPWTRFFQMMADDAVLKEPGSENTPASAPGVATPASDGPGDTPVAQNDSPGDDAGPGPAPNLDSRCPSGDCPPATVNILCQRHPSLGAENRPENYDGEYAGRVIFKFSSLDRDQVDAILGAFGYDAENPVAFENIPTAELVTDLALGIRLTVEALLPEICLDCGLKPDAIEVLTRLRGEGLDVLQAEFTKTLTSGITGVSGGGSILEAIYEAAYAGVPCFDTTTLLSGTFSHSVVSSFLSVTGGVVSSSTGSSGMFGSINLVGIPVGTADFYVSYTDRNGDPNPAFCGSARFALGPLELGQMRGKLDCEGCVTGYLGALGEFFGGLAGDTLAANRPLVDHLIEQATGVSVAGIQSLGGLFGPQGAFTPEQQAAVMAQFFNLPALLSAPDPELVQGVTLEMVAAVADRLVDLVLAINDRVAPELVYCESINPKIFGFPLMGGELVGSSLFMGRVEDQGQRYDEIVTQMRFSPAYMVNYYTIGLLSGGAGAMMLPALDSADMSFGTRVRTPDRATLDTFLKNPLLASSERIGEMIENSLFTFTYRLDPFGMTLADGQARLVVPSLNSHPNARLQQGQPAWTVPAGRDVPSREELLLAALAPQEGRPHGVLSDATWRGLPGQLDDLFPDDPARQAALQDYDLVRDFFPHGGLLGASKLVLPKPITDAPPLDRFAVIADQDASPLDRLAAFLEVWDGYITATSTVGELALYVPAPNPPGLLSGQPLPTPEAFASSLRAMDPQALFAGTGDLELLAFDQAFITGWLDVPLLGIPVGRATVEGRPAEGSFRIEAEAPADGWLKQLLGATSSLEFAITAPRAYEEASAGVDPFGPASGFKIAGFADLRPLVQQAMDSGDAGNLAATLADELVAQLPRVSLDAAIDFQVPASVSSFLQVASGSGSSVRMFGFSPAFEPGYLAGTANPGAYALARRRGGIGVRGNFTLAYALIGLSVDIPDAAFAMVGGDGLTPPRFLGNLTAPQVVLPSGIDLADIELAFDSAPEPGDDLIRIQGRATPPDFSPLLTLTPSVGDGRIGATLRVIRSAPPATTPGVRMEFDPVDARIPFLGDSLTVRVHGATPGEPFSHSSFPGEAWAATLTVDGVIELRNPLDPAGPVLARVEAGGPYPLAQISGIGLESFTLRVILPSAALVTMFPGQATETVLVVGDAGMVCLLADSSGRVYVDLGHRTLPLAAGLLEATGRVEFGMEPLPVATGLTLGSASLAFGSVEIGRSALQTVNLTNRGRGRLTVDTAVTTGAGHYQAEPVRVVLDGLETRPVAVRFMPQATGVQAGVLTLSAADGGAVLHAIPLSGTGAGVPRLHVSDSALDFGAVQRGRTEARRFVVTNAGSAPLEVSSTLASTVFKHAPVSFTVPAGGRTEVTVSFTPGADGAFAGSLALSTPAGPATISLAGAGEDRNWHLQRTEGETLRSVHFHTATDGWAVGDGGLVLRATNGGRVWSDESGADATAWRGVVFDAAGTRGLMAGLGGEVRITTNSGGTWTTLQQGPLGGPALDWHAAARATSDRFVLVGGFNGSAIIALEQADGTWAASAFPGVPPLHDVAFLSENQKVVGLGIAVGPDRTVLQTTNGGANWTVVEAAALPFGFPSTSDFRAVASNRDVTAPQFLIVGDGGVVLRSTDRAVSWQYFSLPKDATADLHAVEFAPGADNAFVSGDSGVIWRSFDDGGGWAWADDTVEPVGTHVRAFAGFATTHGMWAVGTAGGVHRREPLTTGAPMVATGPLSFSGVAFGERGFGTIVVHNPGALPVTVTSALTSGPFTVTPASATIGPDGAAAFHVVYAPERGGELDGVLLTLASGGTTLVQVPVLGHTAGDRWRPMVGPSADDIAGLHVFDTQNWMIATTREVYRTTTAGASWTATAAGDFAAMAFDPTSGTGFVGGGQPGAGVILRSADFGITWDQVALPAGVARVTDLAMTQRTGGAVGAIASTEAGDGVPARVLISQDGGVKWTLRDDPVLSGFAGGAVWRRDDDLFVTHGNNLYMSRSLDRWLSVLTAAQPLRDVSFASMQSGWTVGDVGTVWHSSDGGGPGTWIQPAAAPAGNHRHVDFADADSGWIVSRGGGVTFIHGTQDGGVTWAMEHVETVTAGGREVLGVHAHAARVALAYGTRGGLWRYEPAIAQPEGFLGVPAQIDLGTVAVGASGSLALEIPNLGTAPVTLFAPVIETPGGAPLPFIAGGFDPVVAPGRSGRVEVLFRPTAAGTFRATLHLASDSAHAGAAIELVGRGVAVPATIIVDTAPAGGSIRIDGANTTLPAVFRVVEGTARTGQWSLGAARSLLAGAFNHRDGVDLHFARWRDRGGEVLQTATAHGVSSAWIAEYQAAPPPPPLFVAPPVARPQPCASFPLNAGVITGPWLRVSDASLGLTALGDDGRMLAQGGILLSVDRAEAALQTSALSLAAPDGGELVGLTAGSWQLDLVDGVFSLEAHNPGLRVLGRPAVPPAALTLLADTTAGHIAGSFTTTEDLPLLPAVIEFGPGSASFDFGAAPALRIAGNIRLLRGPDGAWALERPFLFDSSGPSPVGLQPPVTLLDIGMARIRADAQTALVVQRTDSTITLGATDLLFDGFGQTAFSFSPTVNSTGQVALALALDADGLRLGPARLTPLAGQPAPAFAWNALTGAIQVEVPASRVALDGTLGLSWPVEDDIRVPAFSFDSSGDFEHVLSFPSSFAGIPLPVVDPEDNYMILERKAGVPAVRLRNEVTGPLGRTTLRFEAKSALVPTLSGSLRWDVELPPGTGLGTATLSFDPDDAPYEFHARRRLGGVPVELRFGSGGAMACPLVCVPGQPLSECTGGCGGQLSIGPET